MVISWKEIDIYHLLYDVNVKMLLTFLRSEKKSGGQPQEGGKKSISANVPGYAKFDDDKMLTRSVRSSSNLGEAWLRPNLKSSHAEPHSPCYVL